MATLKSYELNGKKLSFANWISTISPQDCPFVSMTAKESVEQCLFQWQNDSLTKAKKNAALEGTKATEGVMNTTTVRTNVTQILRKVVKVSDTANATDNYGRGKELAYQMEKAGKEIKRDLEWTFLNQSTAKVTDPRETAGFSGLVAPLNSSCPETGAVVYKELAGGEFTEAELFDMTYQLYLSGSKANIIMYHPNWAYRFSMLQESATRIRMFEDTDKVNLHVSTLVDPLGQEYKLLPNRWMPTDKVFFYRPEDFTQMVLREPTRVQLAKDGSYEKWMIEMEVGLRLRHPFAAGVLTTKKGADFYKIFNGVGATVDDSPTLHTVEDVTGDTAKSLIFGKAGDGIATHKPGKPLIVKLKLKADATAAKPVTIVINKNGVPLITQEYIAGGKTTALEIKITDVATAEHAGLYSVSAITSVNKDVTPGITLNIGGTVAIDL